MSTRPESIREDSAHDFSWAPQLVRVGSRLMRTGDMGTRHMRTHIMRTHLMGVVTRVLIA